MMNAKRIRPMAKIIIAIAILTTIAVIAISMWRSHLISDRISNAIESTAAAKLVVMEAATVHGGLAHVKASEMIYNAAVLSNPYVAHVEIGDGGRIYITTKDTGAKPDMQLILTPNSANENDGAVITWICSVTEGDAHLAPARCQNMASTDINAKPAAGPATAQSVSSARSL